MSSTNTATSTFSSPAFEFYSAQASDAFVFSTEKALPKIPLAELPALPTSFPIPRISTNSPYSSRPPSYASSFESLPTFESLQAAEEKKAKKSRFGAFFSWKRSSKQSPASQSEDESIAPPPYVTGDDLEMILARLEQMDTLFGGAAIKGL